MSLVATLFHIATIADWETARATGTYRASSLETEGFIHASTRAQLPGTANRFYAGRRDLMLLTIDPNSPVLPPVRYEAADGQMFPHLYGAIPIPAIVHAVPFLLGESGEFILPPLED